jgi:hypothetical protein
MAGATGSSGHCYSTYNPTVYDPTQKPPQSVHNYDMRLDLEALLQPGRAPDERPLPETVDNLFRG